MDLRFIDQQRAGRALIAYLDRDKVAMTAVLDDVRDGKQPEATLGFCLATIQTAAQIIAYATGDAGDAAKLLRMGLASLTADALDLGEALDERDDSSESDD